MTAEVIILPVVTTLDCPPSRVLEMAAGVAMESAVVIGMTEDGEFYFASSVADGGSVLWLLALAKKRLMEIGDPC